MQHTIYSVIPGKGHSGILLHIRELDLGSVFRSALIACFCLFSTAQAQLFEIEAFVSGGSNLSYGATAPLYRKTVTPTFYAQANLGYWFSEHVGVGAGITYFPLGLRSVFSLQELGKNFKYIYAYTYDYLPMPHLYVSYAFSESSGILSSSQVRLGVLYARVSEGSEFDFNGIDQLRDGRVVYLESKSLVKPHAFVGIEGRWDIRLLQTPRHQLFGVIHAVKGLTTIQEITHKYSVGNPSLDQQSFLKVNGDYLGLGISYRWKMKKA